MESSLGVEIIEIPETENTTSLHKLHEETLLAEPEIQDEKHRDVEISFVQKKDSKFSIEIPEHLEIANSQPSLIDDVSSTSEDKISISYIGSLVVTVLKATDLEKKDLFQKADPYVVVELGNQKAKTEKKKNNLNPEWNQKMTFQLNEHSSKLLTFKVFDWDRFGKDDIMGQASLEINEEIITNSQGNAFQLHLQDCKSGILFISVRFEGEIKKMSQSMHGVKELKKYLKEDEPNSKEEVTLKGVKELKNYLLEDDTDMNSKTIITRKTTKTTKVQRKVIIDKHGNKIEVEKEISAKRDDDNQENDETKADKEKDASKKSEWVNIPIIRLDREPSSPAVQIEELSDEEQTEPLDLTNKLVVEGVVSTPSDEENVVDSVEIVEITEEDTDKTHKTLSNTSSLSSTSSSVITVLEMDQKNVKSDKDQEKWSVNMPIIRTNPAAKTSDENKETKRWSVNIPIIREPEKTQDESSEEIKQEQGESRNIVDGDLVGSPIPQQGSKSQENSTTNETHQEEPEVSPNSMNMESISSVSHKVVGPTVPEIYSATPSLQSAIITSASEVNSLLEAESAYSTVSHQVSDLKERQSQFQTVFNTNETEKGSSSLAHQVSQFDTNIGPSVVAHEVTESNEKTDLPLNPIYDQAEEIKAMQTEENSLVMENDEDTIKILKDENQHLKAFIPDDILDNLPSELQQSLLQEVYQARDNIVKADLKDNKTERKETEKEIETEKKFETEKEIETSVDSLSEEVNQNQSSGIKSSTSDIEELMGMVDSLDEETSKHVLEELQKVLTEIDEDIKAQKIASMREDLIKLQIEQSKLMPSLPAEIVSNLPPEILQGIEGAMKDAFLEMAKDTNESKEKDEPKIKEIITEGSGSSKERELAKEKEKDKISEVESMITEFMESDEEDELPQNPAPLAMIPSIPEELLNTIPPEMAAMLQASFDNTIAQLNPQTDNKEVRSPEMTPKTPSSKKSSLSLKVDDEREPNIRNNDTDNDDVSLPPTPAVQPSWSFIASQPARPQAPTPDSGSNSESTELTRVHQLDETTPGGLVSIVQTQIPSEILDLANTTADKVITDAEAILALQEDGNVTVTHRTDEGIVTLKKEKSQAEKRKNSTIISTQELHQDQVTLETASDFVTKTIDDAKRIVMRISDNENIREDFKDTQKVEHTDLYKEENNVENQVTLDITKQDQVTSETAGNFVTTKTIDDAKRMVMRISEDENIREDFKDTKEVEHKDLDEEERNDKNKATLESNERTHFQEIQIIKSRACTEEDRFVRNDSEDRSTKNETNVGCIESSSSTPDQKTKEQTEQETEEKSVDTESTNIIKVETNITSSHMTGEETIADSTKYNKKSTVDQIETSTDENQLKYEDIVSSDKDRIHKDKINENILSERSRETTKQKEETEQEIGLYEEKSEDTESTNVIKVETNITSSQMAREETIADSTKNISKSLVETSTDEEKLKDEDKVSSDKYKIQTNKIEENIISEGSKESIEEDSEKICTNKNAIVSEPEKSHETDEENVVEDVHFQRISDEELLCMENIKSMTENLKRKISGTKKPNNRYRFELKTVKTTKEVKETIENDMRNTRAAIQRKQTIVIEQTIITIVESVSDWLDRVEYKISTVKRIKTINQRKEELKNIKEEIEVIEETVDELVEVTELAVEVLNDDSKVTITSCVQCLTENVKIVKLQRQQSEDELSDSEGKWEEYLEGVKTVGGLIQDLKAEVEKVENTDEVLEEKIDTLEDLEVMNKGHINKVTYLLATGNGLVADLQENKVPDEVMTLFQNVRKIENNIQKDKDTVINLLISKSEYEQTLQEYESIIKAAEFFLTTKVKITEVSQLENEITKQKKFFINLSHCMQVLNSLEEGFSTDILNHFEKQHLELTQKSDSVINQAAHHITSLDQAYTVLTRMETKNQELKSIFLQTEKYEPGSLAFSTDDYILKLDNLKQLKIQLSILEKDFECNQKLLNEVKKIVNLEDYHIDLTLKNNISDQLSTVVHHIKKLEKFSEHWQNYEENYSIIQQWLGSAEEELQKEGSIDLIIAEQHSIQQNYDNGHLQFLRALEDQRVLDDEEQRTYKLQIEGRWQQMERELNNIKESRKEVIFNNSKDICDRTEEIIEQGKAVLNQTSFGNNEDLLLFMKKIGFLKLKAERINYQIQPTNVASNDIEAIETVGVQKQKLISIIKQLEEKNKEAKSSLESSCSFQRDLSKIKKNIEELSKQLEHSPYVDIDLSFKEIENDSKVIFKTYENLKIDTYIIESNIEQTSSLQTCISGLNQSIEQNKQIMKERQKFSQELQKEIQNMDNSTNATNFKLDLTLARGHIDLKRLKSSSEKIKVNIDSNKSMF